MCCSNRNETLAASCNRKPTEGMEVNSASREVKDTQKMIFELLAADQPCKNSHPDLTQSSGNGAKNCEQMKNFS